MKLIKNPEFTHTVKVKTPVDGGHQEDTFKARFKMIAHSRMQEAERLCEDEDKTRAFLREILINAEDIEDEQGKPLAWNDELRDHLIDMPHTRNALFFGYFEAFSAAKAGN